MHGGLPEFQRSGATFDSSLIDAAGGDFITVPDVQLLFNGDFKRVGDSLKIVGDDGKSFLVQDYFKSDRLQSLVAPDGALLTGDVVAALAGPLAPGQYAQAQ